MKRPCKSDMPARVYLLWYSEGKRFLDARMDGCYMSFFSRDKALEQAEHELKTYGIECIPVRVK